MLKIRLLDARGFPPRFRYAYSRFGPSAWANFVFNRVRKIRPRPVVKALRANEIHSHVDRLFHLRPANQPLPVLAEPTQLFFQPLRRTVPQHGRSRAVDDW